MQPILLAILLLQLNLQTDAATTTQKSNGYIRRFFHTIPYWIWIIVGIVLVVTLMTIVVSCILCKSQRDSEKEIRVGKLHAKRKKRAASLLLPSQQQSSSELGAGGKTSGTKKPQHSETLVVPTKKSANKKRVIDWESASPQASDRLEMWNNQSSH